MGLSVASGSFTAPSSTGHQAITGVGFTPQLVLFALARNGDGATAVLGFGAAKSSSARWAMTWRSNNAQAAGSCDHGFKADRCLIQSGGGGSGTNEADFVSMDADGFTLNWTQASVTVRRLHYLALAGTALQSAVGTFDLLGTGQQAVTGVGFQPKALLLGHALAGLVEGYDDDALMALGCATGTSEQWVAGVFGVDGADTTDEQSFNKTDRCHAQLAANLSFPNAAALASFGADGFTLDASAVAAAHRIGYVALGGSARFKALSAVQPASTGSQVITGVGFTPAALLSASGGQTANAAGAHSRMGLGFGLSGTNRRVASASATDAVATTETSSGSSEAALVRLISGASPTLDAVADLTSLDSDGFTLNWTTTDSAARQTLFLAIGAGPTEVAVALDTPADASGGTTLDAAIQSSLSLAFDAAASGGGTVAPTVLLSNAALTTPPACARALIGAPGVVETGDVLTLTPAWAGAGTLPPDTHLAALTLTSTPAVAAALGTDPDAHQASLMLVVTPAEARAIITDQATLGGTLFVPLTEVVDMVAESWGPAAVQATLHLMLGPVQAAAASASPTVLLSVLAAEALISRFDAAGEAVISRLRVA